MKIGFFGDSFCCEIENIDSRTHGYQTYLKKLQDFYNAEIVNFGYGGSSVWDLVLQQFPPFKDALPDVCIFCWTDTGRIYNKNLRNLTYGNVLDQKLKDIKPSDLIYQDVRTAAKYYFKSLYDPDKHELEYKSLLYYFDHQVLSEIHNKTKIVHMWSTENKYQWTYGQQISTPLVQFVDPKMDRAANHIYGDAANQQVFELIKSSLG